MELSSLQVGKKIEIIIKNPLDNMAKLSFISQFEEIEDRENILVSAPLRDGIIYPIQLGTSLEIFFIHKMDLFKFKASVINRTTSNILPFLVISQISDIERIQRRQFYRFERNLDLTFGKFDMITHVESDEKISACTKDLSGGGLCMYTDCKLDIDTIINCEIILDEENKIKFLARVARRTESENSNHKYEIGICYKRISNLDRETIVRYIFIEQRKLRKKGLV